MSYLGLTLREEIQKLSSEELERAVTEIREWSKSGILRNGIVRGTLESYFGKYVMPSYSEMFVFLLEFIERCIEGCETG